MNFWASIFFLLAAHSTLLGEEVIRAYNQEASPTNQRRAHGNACGPASLLNAFHYGSKKWQRAFDAVPGNDSKTRINYVISRWGLKPSRHIKDVKRWDQRGINLVDLHDVANEMCDYHWLPKIKYEVLARKQDEPSTQLLHRSHKRIVKSLEKGLPPILCIRRYAYRKSKELETKSWWPISAHFIVVIETTTTLKNNGDTFRIKYIDPYGGHIREGIIQTNTSKFTNSPFLAANLPSATIGNSLLKKGESSILTFSAVMGRW